MLSFGNRIIPEGTQVIIGTAGGYVAADPTMSENVSIVCAAVDVTTERDEVQAQLDCLREELCEERELIGRVWDVLFTAYSREQIAGGNLTTVVAMLANERNALLRELRWLRRMQSGRGKVNP